MIISKVVISNFRCFERLEVEFDERLTVLVGKNGAGKTAVLDAVTVAVGSLTAELGRTSFGISKDDAREVCYELGSGTDVQPQFPVEIEAWGVVDGRKIGWMRLLKSLKGRTTWVDADDFRSAAASYARRVAAGDPSLILPVVSYYGTGRLWAQKREKQNAPREKSSRLNGYLDSLAAATDNKLMNRWFEKMTMRDLQKGSPSPEFMAVRQALAQFVTRLTGGGEVKVYYDLDEQAIYLSYILPEGRHVVTSLNKLSDGYKSFLSLIADIAYRMAMLNPQLLGEVLNETPGVVLIDEVDLHLHPAWQHRILGDLTSIFPKVQFIVSTHAPAVIQSSAKGRLVMLSEGETPTASTLPYGRDVNSIMTEVMEVPSRPAEVGQLFDDFHRHMDEQAFDKAGHTLEELAGILGEDDPELSACRVNLQVEQWS